MDGVAVAHDTGGGIDGDCGGWGGGRGEERVGDGGVDAGGGCGGGEEGEEDEEVGHVLGRGGWGGGGGLGGFVGRGGVGGGHYAVWRFLWVEGTGRKIMYGC